MRLMRSEWKYEKGEGKQKHKSKELNPGKWLVREWQKPRKCVRKGRGVSKIPKKNSIKTTLLHNVLSATCTPAPTHQWQKYSASAGWNFISSKSILSCLCSKYCPHAAVSLKVKEQVAEVWLCVEFFGKKRKRKRPNLRFHSCNKTFFFFFFLSFQDERVHGFHESPWTY